MAHATTTQVLAVDPQNPDREIIERAALVLRGGGLVAFPTETVYGLGANALDAAAVRRIFEAKERSPSDPVIVHIAELSDLAHIVREVPQSARALAARFWPGPLTLVLPKRPEVPDEVTAGLDTVAVRQPSHPVAAALIRAAGVPIAAPSANLFTRTSATTAQHVLDDLGGRIDMVLDGGPTRVGVESTVVAIDEAGIHILRPGAVPMEAIEAALREDAIDVTVTLARPRTRMASPGLLGKHYAPRADLCYIRGEPGAALARLREELAAERGRLVGLLLAEEDVEALGELARDARLALLGPTRDPDVMAQRLYAGLRALDSAGVEIIYARQPHGPGIIHAIDDRLRRAATTIIDAR